MGHMYLVRGSAWPRGRTIQPSFHSGMHALVIYHSINTSTDLPKKYTWKKKISERGPNKQGLVFGDEFFEPFLVDPQIPTFLRKEVSMCSG